MIRAYRSAPKELFRINNGRSVRLRPWTHLRYRKAFDIIPTDIGYILPKALDPATYRPPNGASMRPNSPYQHHLVKIFNGNDTIIYALPQGTLLPADLILVHERFDHWSLQPAKEMTLDELNETITGFLQEQATILTPGEWLKKYPVPTSDIHNVKRRLLHRN